MGAFRYAGGRRRPPGSRYRSGVRNLNADVRSLWPDAPVRAADPVGRWLRAAAPDGASVYLQVYAWDDDSYPHYVLARVAGGAAADQRRFVRLEEAVDALRSLCAASAPDELATPIAHR